MKLALLGIVAVALVAGAGFLAVWWATRPIAEPQPRPAVATLTPDAAAPPAAPLQGAAATPTPSLAPPPPPRVSPVPAPLAQVRHAPAPAAPEGAAWEEIPPIPVRRLPAISSALEQARPRLARCFDPEEQARHARRSYTSIGSPRAGPGGAVLLLELEAAPGGTLRVVDAPVEARGAAEDGLLACAQEALRGLELGRTRGGDPARLRVRYPLAPVVSGAVTTRPAPRVRLRPH